MDEDTRDLWLVALIFSTIAVIFVLGVLYLQNR